MAQNICVRFSEKFIEVMDYLVEIGLFESRSSFIREACRFLLMVLLNSSEKLNPNERKTLAKKYLGELVEAVR